MRQENKENYIKEMYKLGGFERRVSNKSIAESLQVASSSVTEMINKLNKEGIVVNEPYKGTILTKKGKHIALGLLRVHRLWEVFLIEHLGYKWSEAHEEAEALEHASSKKLVECLNNFLNYPSHCPHGTPIPNAHGEVEVMDLKALSEWDKGFEVRVCQITEEKNLLNRLEALGMKIGSILKILEVSNDENGPLIFLNGQKERVSYEDACNIYAAGEMSSFS